MKKKPEFEAVWKNSPGDALSWPQKGFTLMEMTVVISATIMVIGLIATVMISSMDIYSTVTFMSDNNNGALRISNVMLTDIRQVKDRSSINEATAHRFGFANTGNDSITYGYLSGEKRLTRKMVRNGIVEADSSFFSGISDFSFLYQDADGNLLNPASDPLEDIRKVQVVFVDSSAQGVGVMSSKVYLRNLR